MKHLYNPRARKLKKKQDIEDKAPKPRYNNRERKIERQKLNNFVKAGYFGEDIELG